MAAVHHLPLTAKTAVRLAALLAYGCSSSGSPVDPCHRVDCSLFGICEVKDGQAVCRCAPGYISRGLVCEANHCGAFDCGHGRCAQDAEQAWCLCDAGWQGEHCDRCAFGYHADNGACLPDQPCDQQPCLHGVCRLVGTDEVCDCHTGYAGVTCHTCAEGFYHDGLRCFPVVPDPCTPNPCQEAHRTVCVAQNDTFVCNCDEGYHEEGSACLPDVIDPCEPNPCQQPNRKVCVPDNGELYHCACNAGFAERDGFCVMACDGNGLICSAAHESVGTLVSANGFGAVGYDIAGHKADSFLEHIYRNWDEGIHTRDLLFDTYLGVRTASSNLWLNDLEPAHLEYLEQTGIIHSVHLVDGFAIHTYLWAPWELSRPALVLLGQVVNEGTSAATVSLYTIHNYHLGDTQPGDPVNPDANGERIHYLTTSGAYFESGPGGGLLYAPLDEPDHHGVTPDNPYQRLQSGQDLTDNADSGLGNDQVAGFQKDFSLAPGQNGSLGVVTAFDPSGDQATLESAVGDVYGDLDGPTALSQALAAWEAWRHDPPAGLSAAEVWVYRHSEAFLRQGQVWETSDLSKGQILASLPPGNWNICWIRDMAYALVALVKSGHFAEARAGLEFVLLADSGYYENDYVGVPYQVTITRYFGRGKEESDANADGPNIEYDGFGLFLWALGEYVRASGDTSLLDDYWPLIRDEIAGALVALVDPETGLIAADSSIWEVHWHGQQKRYTYTSLAAARGLCEAAAFATSQGDDTTAATYRNTGRSIRDKITTHLRDSNQALASSYEELQSGSGYRDMASIEGLNWLLFEPMGVTGLATLDAFESDLRVASGFGFYRNDDGGWYDSQEWVFVDLRAAIGNRLAGRTGVADTLVEWITAQAVDNHGIIAELHHPDNGDYEGELPMIGFGAGGYILALYNRSEPPVISPFCGTWE